MVEGSLTPYEVRSFLTLPDEHLIIAKRQHWYVLVAPVTLAILGEVVLLFLTYLLYTFGNIRLDYMLLAHFTIDAVVATSLLYLFVDWYFHFYIITDRKILEVQFVPLVSYTINDVFLDQVRTTEIDVKINSIIHELIDCGDINIVFDRPSHEEVFTLKNIRNPKDTGLLIANELETIMHDAPIWFHPRSVVNTLKFTDQAYPARSHHH